MSDFKERVAISAHHLEVLAMKAHATDENEVRGLDPDDAMEIVGYLNKLCRAAPEAGEAEPDDRIAFLRGVTLVHPDAEIVPAAMSYMKPDVYQRMVNDLLDSLVRRVQPEGERQEEAR